MPAKVGEINVMVRLMEHEIQSKELLQSHACNCCNIVVSSILIALDYIPGVSGNHSKSEECTNATVAI